MGGQPERRLVAPSPAGLPFVHGRWKHGEVLFDGVSHQLPDADPTETAEWLDAFDDVVDVHGRTRARYLLMRILERAGQKHVDFPATVSSPYVNTIPSDEEPAVLGQRASEPLQPGSLLVAEDLSNAPLLPSDDALVGTSLGTNEAPAGLAPGDSVIVATTNTAHLARYCDARLWTTIV